MVFVQNKLQSFEIIWKGVEHRLSSIEIKHLRIIVLIIY